MKRIAPVFLSLLLLLAGCAVSAAPCTEDFVGTYPVEGYAPDPWDLAAVPYSYQGQGRLFSVQCTVRELTEAERTAKLQLTAACLSQLELTQKQHPEQADRCAFLIGQVSTDLGHMQSARALYVTEITATPLQDLPENALVRYTITSGGQTLLSSAATAGAVPWLSLVNTDDGLYSEGLLLPFQDEYTLHLTCADHSETITLT